MFSYKGKTFCEFEDCVSWGDCPRAMTPDVKAKAIEWGASFGCEPEDTPISFFLNKPDCFATEVGE